MSDALAPAPDLFALIREHTPARVIVGRTGTAYRTATQLALRGDHAAARDAVWATVDPARDLGAELLAVSSRAATRQEHLLRPDLGRQFDDDSRRRIGACPRNVDLQVFIGDGLSASAVRVQVPRLLPLLLDQAQRRGWSLGPVFFVRHARVGLLNEVGELIDPCVAVLLIGERPGLATAESLSAYMAYRPRPGDTDAKRNLISNIHDRGLPPAEAAPRILALAEQMRRAGASGVAIKEELPAPALPIRRDRAGEDRGQLIADN